MRHTMVTYTVKPGHEEENATLVRAVFEELARVRPAGLRYAVLRFPDSRRFVHLHSDDGTTTTGLQQLPAFRDFLAGARERHEQPATSAEAELIGSYRIFEDQDGPGCGC